MAAAELRLGVEKTRSAAAMSSVLAVNHAVATHARRRVIHRRVAALRVPAELAFSDDPGTAHPAAGARMRPFVAAEKVLPVYHRVAATHRVVAELL